MGGEGRLKTGRTSTHDRNVHHAINTSLWSVDRTQWLTLLGLAPEEVPQLLITEGTWWRSQALAMRLQWLTDVRETGMPDLWWGRHDGVPVAYCTAYGAARAVEPVHVLATCGTPRVVQIGSCGGFSVPTGTIVVSDAATIGDGASQYYGGVGVSRPTPSLVERAAALLPAARVGPTVSTDALLAQPAELLERWANAGHLGVDMETSAVFSAAAHFGVEALSLLFVWDELPGRSWTDAFSAKETAAQEAANALTFATALRLLR
jgi:uridine phosphorylase